MLFHIDLPTLRLREHKALLLGQQDLARFGLFDQLNTAVDGEHFHLLSGCLPGSSNTRTQTKKPPFTYVHIQAYTSSWYSIKFKNQHFFFFPCFWKNLTNHQEDDSFTFNTFVCCVFMKSKINIRFCCFQHCADSDAV